MFSKRPNIEIDVREQDGEVHMRLVQDHMPQSVEELVEYLRTMACVDYETGYRRMPNYVDDEIFAMAANLIESHCIVKEEA